jgi:hypothetical protein
MRLEVVHYALSVPKIKFDSRPVVIRLSGVSEPTKQDRVFETIHTRLVALGYTVNVGVNCRLTWRSVELGARMSGSVIVYGLGNVVGELPAEYYL